MFKVVLRFTGATGSLLAVVGVCASPASGAERRVSVQALSGSGTYSIVHDNPDDTIGPVLYFNQRFDWQLLPDARRAVLRLPERGRQRLRAAVRAHVSSTGGSHSFPYTCQAQNTYTTTALVEAKASRSGWRLQIRPLRPGGTTSRAPGSPTRRSIPCCAAGPLWRSPNAWRAASSRAR